MKQIAFAYLFYAKEIGRETKTKATIMLYLHQCTWICFLTNKQLESRNNKAPQNQSDGYFFPFQFTSNA